MFTWLGGERFPQRFGYGNVCHRTPPSRACWMNRLSAMARRSSLPKRIERPSADAYCSAARAASMLAVRAARNAVSAGPELAGGLAASLISDTDGLLVRITPVTQR